MQYPAYLLLAGGMLTGAGPHAQQLPAPPNFALRPGWLCTAVVDNRATVRFDSVAATGKHNIPVQWARLDGNLLVFDNAGGIATGGRGGALSTVYRRGKQEYWPAQPLLYASQHLLFLVTVDGYLSPRRYRLLELNLATGTSQELAVGKHFGGVRYAPDLSRVYYTQDDKARQWLRKTR